jgi:hypothetical protein
VKGTRLVAIALGTLLPLLAPHEAQARTRIYVEIAPPAPIVDVRAVAPSAGHVWLAGYHRWDGGAYVWVPGYWVVPPRHRTYWVAGGWVQHRRGWYWSGGRWR